MRQRPPLQYQGHSIYPLMRETLIAHVAGPQPLIREGRRGRSVDVLIKHGWLRPRSNAGRETMLTAAGRPVAALCLDSEADRLNAELENA